jgi:predicted amidophosphoribosyltransferase
MKRIEFKVGQKVVALTNPKTQTSPIRVKGNIYTVLDIMYCVGCGEQMVDINTSRVCGGKGDHLICTCGSRQNNNATTWTASKAFAPLDNLSESIAEAVSNEDYELAELLTTIHTENFQLTELGL